jgi:hypothetical protein
MDLSPFKLDIDELINEFVEVFTWICYFGLFLSCLAIVFQEGLLCFDCFNSCGVRELLG